MSQEIWPFWGVREPVSAGTHFPAFVCAIYATLFLWRLCKGDRPRQWAMACYGLCLMFQYAASTAYHSVPGTSGLVHHLRLLDQSAIFALIAGTYTPAFYVFVCDPLRRRLLIKGIWSLAGAGVAAKWLLPREPYWLTVAVYFSLATSGLLVLKELRQAAGYRGMLWVAYGGIFYTLGTMVDYFEWPALYPGVFAHHELFHVCTMAGAFCHFAFILLFVVSYSAGEMGRQRGSDSPAFALALSKESA